MHHAVPLQDVCRSAGQQSGRSTLQTLPHPRLALCACMCQSSCCTQWVAHVMLHAAAGCRLLEALSPLLLGAAAHLSAQLSLSFFMPLALSCLALLARIKVRGAGACRSTGCWLCQGELHALSSQCAVCHGPMVCGVLSKHACMAGQYVMQGRLRSCGNARGHALADWYPHAVAQA